MGKLGFWGPSPTLLKAPAPLTLSPGSLGLVCRRKHPEAGGLLSSFGGSGPLPGAGQGPNCRCPHLQVCCMGRGEERGRGPRSLAQESSPGSPPPEADPPAPALGDRVQCPLSSPIQNFKAQTSTPPPTASSLAPGLSPLPPAPFLFSRIVCFSGPVPAVCSTGQRRNRAPTQPAALSSVFLQKLQTVSVGRGIPQTPGSSSVLRERERRHLGDGLGAPELVRLPAVNPVSALAPPSCPGVPGVKGPVRDTRREWQGGPGPSP